MITPHKTKLIHSLQASIGIVFGFFVGYVAYTNSIEGRPDLTPGRVILSVLLVGYSISQFIRLGKYRVTLVNLISFPVIYIVFGLFWEFSSRGYIKNWAPATQEAAQLHNIISLLIILALIGLAWLTTFKAKKNGNVT